MSKINYTSECEGCQYCTIDETNKARIKVTCSYKEKTYPFGMYIECDNFTKRGTEND